jgi:hypothetical protein
VSSLNIPPFNNNGFLPLGVYVCSLEEVHQRFGSFHSNDGRVKLFEKLQMFVSTLRQKQLAAALIVNGSFATTKACPSDIDLVLVLHRGHDFSGDVTPDEYNLLSKRRVRKTFGFDMFVAEDESEDYLKYVRFCQDVKNQPGELKGVLRIEL